MFDLRHHNLYPAEVCEVFVIAARLKQWRSGCLQRLQRVPIHTRT